MQICPPEMCVGCCACMNVCPVSCIKMEEDRFGEVHPIVRDEICINCYRCKAVCPANSDPAGNQPSACYVAWSRDARLRKTCSSGGLATEIARSFITKGGHVFCVDWDAEMNLIYRCVTSGHALIRSKGSKYAHAYVGTSCREAKQLLDNGQSVLFIGLPCQIDGLHRFLGRKAYDNLCSIDFVCHGAPPVRYLQEYIRFLSKLYRKPVDYVNFRDEQGYNCTAYSNKLLVYRNARDPYFMLYGGGVIYRQCCYQCKYATAQMRVGDLTLGDFHGVGKLAPFTAPRKNSLLLVNTQKGSDTIRAYQDRFVIEERPIAEAIQGNPQLKRPSLLTNEHRRFRRNYPIFGFVMSAFLTRMVRRNLLHHIKGFLNRRQQGDE